MNREDEVFAPAWRMELSLLSYEIENTNLPRSLQQELDRSSPRDVICKQRRKGLHSTLRGPVHVPLIFKLVLAWVNVFFVAVSRTTENAPVKLHSLVPDQTLHIEFLHRYNILSSRFKLCQYHEADTDLMDDVVAESQKVFAKIYPNIVSLCPRESIVKLTDAKQSPCKTTVIFATREHISFPQTTRWTGLLKSCLPSKSLS